MKLPHKTVAILLGILSALLFFSPAEAWRFIPKPELLTAVFETVEHNYVDPGRIIPKKMFEGALKKLSSEIVPVLTTLEEKKGELKVTISVYANKKVFLFPAMTTLQEMETALQKIVMYTKQHLDKTEKLENVDYAVINGALQKLDPHTSLLVPQVYSDFSIRTQGNFGGVGMLISLNKKGELTIVSPIDDTPASQAGLRSKDHIVQIDGESTINMSLNDAVSKLRGKKGTKVVLYIMRKGLTSPKKVPIVRAIIKIKSVESHVFNEANEKRIGYIQIKDFQQNTHREIEKALESMAYDLSDFQGLILDLRNNPGGLLDQAIKVSDRFLSTGVIVATAGVQGAAKEIRANWFNTDSKIPMIVLVNHGSASASEIVAAALKNNKRAVLVGNTTFGKGSVQQVYPMRDGSALKITMAKYLTPGNKSIQSVGVSPHLETVPYFVSTDYLRITPLKNGNGESELEENFKEWGDKGENPDYTLFYLFDEKKKDIHDEQTKELEEKEEKENKKNRLENDFVVKLARNALLKNDKKNQKVFLGNTLQLAKLEEKRQESKLIEKLATLGVDWKSYPKMPQGKIAVKGWVEINQGTEKEKKWVRHEGEIPADSEVRLFLEVQNIGNINIAQLLADSKAKYPILDELQFVFGYLRPSQSKRWFIPIKVDKSSISRSDRIQFNFVDEEKRLLLSYNYNFAIREKPMPKFSYEISTLENGKSNSNGNGNGILQQGETIAIVVKVKNKGLGESGQINMLLKNGEGKLVYLKKGRTTLKPLASGKEQTVSFLFDLRGKPVDGDLDFSLDILDGTFPIESINHKFKLPLKIQTKPIYNTAPLISVKEATLVSKNKNLAIPIIVEDDQAVKDIYIFNNNNKVYYTNFLQKKPSKIVRFYPKIELKEENNQIIIFSRDEQNVTSRKVLNIRLENKLN